ncbi:IS110 family transposase [Nocardia sp. NPDC046763]|uniref:IS110 family transposase n=1 Tax=Nocardia sp. NPDC046763 TaxID=3155256 RepID=UPI0033CC71B0
MLSASCSCLDALIKTLVTQINPALLELPGVGPDTAGQLLVTAGDNPGRIRSEAAFAKLTGTAPIPASSGRTDRHRLNRGGDRKANAALYRIVIVRLRHHQPTRAYVERRTAQGLAKRDIIRCPKRYVSREIYHTLTTPNTTKTPLPQGA